MWDELCKRSDSYSRIIKDNKGKPLENPARKPLPSDNPELLKNDQTDDLICSKCNNSVIKVGSSYKCGRCGTIF